MRVQCVTTVSVDKSESWPQELPSHCLPRVGDKIESAHSWNGRYLVLEVTEIVWKGRQTYNWYPEIRLGVPNGNFDKFVAYYEKLIESPSEKDFMSSMGL